MIQSQVASLKHRSKQTEDAFDWSDVRPYLKVVWIAFDGIPLVGGPLRLWLVVGLSIYIQSLFILPYQ